MIEPTALTITPLPWDSAFLGSPVGRITHVAHDLALSDLRNEARRAGFRLLYWEPTVAAPDATPDFAAARSLRPLVRRIQFELPLTPDLPLDAWPAAVRHATEPTATLRRLAVQSGEFSRFRIDELLPQGTCERLYITWLDNSFPEEHHPQAVLVWQQPDNPEPVGLITVAQHPDGTAIGLLAVDAGFRGQGIGQQLLTAARHLARQWSSYGLQVATQLENEAGCRFYQRNGFHVAALYNTYHLWL